MATLRDLREQQCQITLYCQGFCTHSWSPSWDQLIQYFGPDYDLVSRNHWDRLICEQCGHRGALVILQPPAATSGVNSGIGGQSPGCGYVSVEEATKLELEREAERKRLGIRSNAEISANTREWFKSQRKAEKAGTNFIGPPSPWAYRKRGRWM